MHITDTLRKRLIKKKDPLDPTERIFKSQTGWFVETREGRRGPFRTQALASLDAETYARRMAEEPVQL